MVPRYGLGRCGVRVSRELDLDAGLGGVIDPASGNHRARTHRCQHRSRLGRFRLAEATGTETVDRPGAETDRALGSSASSVVETALELDGGGPGWGALRSSGLRFVVGTVFMRALISGASSQVRDR